MNRRHLILGGARSGKTGVALECAREYAQQANASVTYVATARALDADMSDRIARHRAERPPTWRTEEAPLQLGATLARLPSATVVVIDCLTLWLSNALLLDFVEEQPRAPLATWNAERAAFIDWLASYAGDVVIVSNEVGSGIVPVSALARRFQDEQGWLNQAVARICERVDLVVAGMRVGIKK